MNFEFTIVNCFWFKDHRCFLLKMTFCWYYLYIKIYPICIFNANNHFLFEYRILNFNEVVDILLLVISANLELDFALSFQIYLKQLIALCSFYCFFVVSLLMVVWCVDRFNHLKYVKYG